MELCWEAEVLIQNRGKWKGGGEGNPQGQFITLIPIRKRNESYSEMHFQVCPKTFNTEPS